MVLIDTPVWVQFLANRAPYARELDRLLAFREVAGHELVYGEVLIGDVGGRRKFLSLYEEFLQARTVSHAEVVDFVRYWKLHGRGIGWIDAHLLASTLLEKITLWTVDARLAAIAAELGIAYHVSG